jgi:hypothetical protein
MWQLNDKGEHEFKGGKQDWKAAARAAEKCSGFQEDDEDELVADESISCYNCRYRRWTVNSFICCK